MPINFFLSSKSQRTDNPALRLLLLAGFTSSALKFALNALSELPGLAEADHTLPLSPWSLKPSHQLPAKRNPRPNARVSILLVILRLAYQAQGGLGGAAPIELARKQVKASEHCLLDMLIRQADHRAVSKKAAKHCPPLSKAKHTLYYTPRSIAIVFSSL